MFFWHVKIDPATGDVLSAKRNLFLNSLNFDLVLSAPDTLINLSKSLRSGFLIFIRFWEKKIICVLTLESSLGLLSQAYSTQSTC